MPAGEPLRGSGAGNRPATPATAYSGHHRLFFFLSFHLGCSVSLDQAKIYPWFDFSYPTGVAKKLPLALLVFFSALLYNQIQPPPQKVPGSPGGPRVTATRTKLRDGRHLAYLESGVPKEQAKYKIIFVHGFFCCRYDVLNVSQVQVFGIDLSMYRTQTNQS